MTEGGGSLFRRGAFVFHSGKPSEWKIDCDALTDDDIETCAWLLATRLRPFSEVYGIPTGGTRLAKAMQNYVTPGDHGPTLIVDDVFTTGGSMFGARSGIAGMQPIWYNEPIGTVIFSHTRQYPSWLVPLFVLDRP